MNHSQLAYWDDVPLEVVGPKLWFQLAENVPAGWCIPCVFVEFGDKGVVILIQERCVRAVGLIARALVA